MVSFSESRGVTEIAPTLASLVQQPELMVMITVYNGAATLAQVLEGYVRVTPPTLGWGMVIIDNASTDATAQILQAFAGRLPLQVLHEATPGIGHARNHGLTTAGSGTVATIFTDDDAVPESDFLVAWEQVLHDYPDRVLFGGRISLAFLERPPRWLARYRRWFSELYTELEDIAGLNREFKPLGPNMAVRQSVLADGMLFDTAIGPNHTRPFYPMGSETEFNDRVLRKSGLPAQFDPRPRVRHLVRPWQTTRAFVRGRAFRLGYGIALLHYRQPDRYAGAFDLGGQLHQLCRRVLAWFGVPRFVWSVQWIRGLRAGQRDLAQD